MNAPTRLDDAALRAWPLPRPGGDADKEARGRVVIVAGSREVPGAALLAGRAALRAGAGKVVVATVASAALPLGLALPEARVIGLDETPGGDIDPRGAERLRSLAGRAGCLLVGPGLLDEGASTELAQALLADLVGVPTLLDASAMAAVAQAASPHAGPVLLTPHAGEMAHLCGSDKAAIEADPGPAALQAARRWQAVVALKGAATMLAAPDGSLWRHEAAVPGLATAGSGDVLAGLIAGLAARGATLLQAAAWGVALHARAGQRLARQHGSLGYLASELAAEVPALLEALGG